MYVPRYMYVYLTICLLIVAYVNGQRQGRIMEKPFNVGETIARENLMYGNHMPKLNVEDEIKMVFESKKSLGENALIQKLKEVGLERYNVFANNTCLVICFVIVCSLRIKYKMSCFSFNYVI